MTLTERSPSSRRRRRPASLRAIARSLATAEEPIAMGEVVLRRGLPEDVAAAVAVWWAASTARRGGRLPSPEREALVHDSIRQPDAFLVVAADAGAVIGIAVGRQGRADDGAGPPCPGLCYIAMVYVAPDRWGEGIGRRTVDAILAEARSRGYDRADLWTHADNRRAQRLYEGRGFRRSGREKDNDCGERIIQYQRRLPPNTLGPNSPLPRIGRVPSRQR